MTITRSLPLASDLLTGTRPLIQAWLVYGTTVLVEIQTKEACVMALPPALIVLTLTGFLHPSSRRSTAQALAQDETVLVW
jgi:hypothetical protein